MQITLDVNVGRLRGRQIHSNELGTFVSPIPSTQFVIISDFDGDRYLGPTDLEQVARLLTRNELSSEEITQIAEKVIEEADVDGDGKLSYMEFEHVILRAPDFLATFHIRI